MKRIFSFSATATIISTIALLVLYIFAYGAMRIEWTTADGSEYYCYSFNQRGVTNPPRENQRLWGFFFAPANCIDSHIRTSRGLREQIHYTGGVPKK